MGPCEETDGCSRAKEAFRQLIFEGLCFWTPFARGSVSLAAASYCSAACESCWELLQHGWCTLQSQRINAASGIILHGEGDWPPSRGLEAELPSSSGPTTWLCPGCSGCPLGTLLLPSKQPCPGRENELLLLAVPQTFGKGVPCAASLLQGRTDLVKGVVQLGGKLGNRGRSAKSSLGTKLGM